ncbi:MAG TPA: vWA domain-containing protein, partial [Thermoanaerobaculia bacterium]
MKRAITIAVLAICAMLPPAAMASESFTLTIPQRFDPSQETGEVRILLSLSAAPAGSQLVIDNATTINLGATQTVAGDSISFESAPSNRVLIRYRPLSNFSGDFCSGAGAVEKNVVLRFSGAQDVVDYRISSYVVGAPAAECSQVSRRIADLPGIVTPGADAVAPALDATYMGRLPLDVMLVLDKSGSIAELPPGVSPASMTTKAMILKSAASAFVANWMMIDAPTGGLNWDEDRMGIVFFDNVATPKTVAGADPPANFFLKRGVGWSPLLTVIDGLAPGGSTSIGAGINSAMQQWKADPAHDAMAIVVTDGMQNTAPLIAATPSGFLGLTPVSGLDAELRKRFIPIQTIGFGTPDVVDENLLRNISFETAGRSYLAIDANTMYDTFAQTLVSILKGNTASIATRSSKSETAVLVDKSARRVVFSLQWAPPSVNAYDLEVLRPNALKVATPTNIQNLPQAEIQSFDLEKPSEGTWTARVRRNPRLRAAGPFTLNVFFLERHLDYRLSVEPRRLRAEISYDGKPLTGLPAGAVRVRVMRPKATLESVLRRTKGQPRRPTPGDPQSKQQLALTALTAADIALIRPAPAELVTLRE